MSTTVVAATILSRVAILKLLASRKGIFLLLIDLKLSSKNVLMRKHKGATFVRERTSRQKNIYQHTCKTTLSITAKLNSRPTSTLASCHRQKVVVPFLRHKVPSSLPSRAGEGGGGGERTNGIPRRWRKGAAATGGEERRLQRGRGTLFMEWERSSNGR